MMIRYVPSAVVKAMIIEVAQMSRTRGNRASWGSDDERFEVGTRHGVNLMLRLAVQVENGMDDPDEIDELCEDLIKKYRLKA